jgi:hypothetical protein
MVTYRVGGEVDAPCARCKLDLAHTILAMVGKRIVRVRCNTCQSDHAYRQTQRRATPAAGRPRASAAERTVLGFEDQLARADVTNARDYKPAETYAVDQVVRHPTFDWVSSGRCGPTRWTWPSRPPCATLVQDDSSAPRLSFSPHIAPSRPPTWSDGGADSLRAGVRAPRPAPASAALVLPALTAARRAGGGGRLSRVAGTEGPGGDHGAQRRAQLRAARSGRSRRPGGRRGGALRLTPAVTPGHRCWCSRLWDVETPTLSDVTPSSASLRRPH